MAALLNPTHTRSYHHSKREMAIDLVNLMEYLGFSNFLVIGHDRGARVAHRMALDYPKHVKQIAVLDIIPTIEHLSVLI